LSVVSALVSKEKLIHEKHDKGRGFHQLTASAREQMKRRNTYYVHAMLSPSNLGKANLTPEEVVSVAPRQVLNFFGSLELP